MFSLSFSEGNTISTLYITSKQKIDILEDSIFLTSRNKMSDKIHYTLVSKDFSNLKSLNKNTEVIKKSQTSELRSS